MEQTSLPAYTDWEVIDSLVFDFPKKFYPFSFQFIVKDILAVHDLFDDKGGVLRKNEPKILNDNKTLYISALSKMGHNVSESYFELLSKKLRRANVPLISVLQMQPFEDKIYAHLGLAYANEQDLQSVAMAKFFDILQESHLWVRLDENLTLEQLWQIPELKTISTLENYYVLKLAHSQAQSFHLQGDTLFLPIYQPNYTSPSGDEGEHIRKADLSTLKTVALFKIAEDSEPEFLQIAEHLTLPAGYRNRGTGYFNGSMRWLKFEDKLYTQHIHSPELVDFYSGEKLLLKNIGERGEIRHIEHAKFLSESLIALILVREDSQKFLQTYDYKQDKILHEEKLPEYDNAFWLFTAQGLTLANFNYEKRKATVMTFKQVSL